MSIRVISGLLVAAAVAFVMACGGSSPLTPSTSPLSIDSFVGTWTASTGGTAGVQATTSTTTQSAAGALTACTARSYTITKRDANHATISYDVTCGDYTVTGSGLAVFQAPTLTWTATGTVTGNGTSCPFQFLDSATRQDANTLLINYTVSICGFGPVSGSHVVHRH